METNGWKRLLRYLTCAGSIIAAGSPLDVWTAIGGCLVSAAASGDD